jgi:AAA domain
VRTEGSFDRLSVFDSPAESANANGLPVPVAEMGAHQPTAEAPQSEAGSSTWEPVDLRAVAAADPAASQPTMLVRSDGVRLLYKGKLHAFNGPSESGKTWLALHICVEQILNGEHVLYIDFEDRPETFIERLLALALNFDAIVEGFHYIRPDDPSRELDRLRLGEFLEAFRPTVAFIDGVTEAMTLHDLELNSNRDVAMFIALLPRRLARSGVAVVQIDHVVKDKEERGRHAIGAQHKLAASTLLTSLRW